MGGAGAPSMADQLTVEPGRHTARSSLITIERHQLLGATVMRKAIAFTSATLLGAAATVALPLSPIIGGVWII